MKKLLNSVLGLLLFFSSMLIDCGIAKGDWETSTGEDSSEEETITDGKGISSEKGITHTQEVPFSKETIDEIKERELKEPPSPPKQRVIPFHEAPPPKELPANEDTKSNQREERDEK